MVEKEISNRPAKKTNIFVVIKSFHNNSVVAYDFFKVNSGYCDKDCCLIYKTDNNPFYIVYKHGITCHVRDPPVSCFKSNVKDWRTKG